MDKILKQLRIELNISWIKIEIGRINLPFSKTCGLLSTKSDNKIFKKQF